MWYKVVIREEEKRPELISFLKRVKNIASFAQSCLSKILHVFLNNFFVVYFESSCLKSSFKINLRFLFCLLNKFYEFLGGKIIFHLLKEKKVRWCNTCSHPINARLHLIVLATTTSARWRHLLLIKANIVDRQNCREESTKLTPTTINDGKGHMTTAELITIVWQTVEDEKRL